MNCVCKLSGNHVVGLPNQLKPRFLSGLSEAEFQEHVSHTTILRNVKFARAVEVIASAVGEDAMAILGGDARLGRQQWQQLAKIAGMSPEAAKKVLALVRTAPTMKASNRIVRQVYAAFIAILEENVPD
jgi:hypothetical protein